MIEQFFTVAQLAENLALSTDKVRKMFQDEPGVLKIGEPSRRLGRKLTRRYYTLCIPASVAERYIARKTNKK